MHLINYLPTVHFHSHKRLYGYFLSSVSDVNEQDEMSTMICFTLKNIFFLAQENLWLIYLYRVKWIFLSLSINLFIIEINKYASLHNVHILKIPQSNTID